MQAIKESSDSAVLDLLRRVETATVSDMSQCMGVTATAVRQRLYRLMGQGLVKRHVEPAGRGRPSHLYQLTAKGRRNTGSNFRDLAVALWTEIRGIEDPEVKRGLLSRVARTLAMTYEDRMQGETADERMQDIQRLFSERDVPFAVDDSGELPVLSAEACPYPDLAEQDRSVCSMERMLFAELLSTNVKLTNCRLDGASCCTFEMS